jgi:phage-related protein (TIGR01555 family)
MARVSVKSAARAAAKANRAATPSHSTAGSIYDGFQNFPLGIGLGTDNASSAAGYGYTPWTRQRQQLEWMMRSSWIAGLGVSVIADDMTRAGVDIVAPLEPQDITEIQTMATRLHIWARTSEAIKASRLYGGAIAVLLVDGQDYSKPLRLDTIGPGQFRGLFPLDRWMLQPSLDNLITEIGPQMGLPTYYTVGNSAPALRDMKIHHTRCIRLIGDELPYWQALSESLWGMSVLERVYDRITHFDAATISSAQLVQKAYIRYVRLEKYRETLAAGGKGAAAVTNFVNGLRYSSSNEGVVVMDAMDEVETTQNSSYDGVIDVVMNLAQQLSGNWGFPMVRAMGQSPGGLNSTGESDFRMYYDSIKQRCERDLRTGMTKVYRCCAASAGIQTTSDFDVVFRSLWQLDETGRADIAQKITATVLAAKEAGAVSDKTALMELKSSSAITGVWDSITDEDIAAAEDEILPAPPPISALPGAGTDEATDDAEIETKEAHQDKEEAA